MKYDLAQTEQHYDNFSYDDTVGELKTSRRKRPLYLIAAAVVAVVVVLALGLGLGLGLRSKSDNTAGNQGENKATEQPTTSSSTQGPTTTSHQTASPSQQSTTSESAVDWLSQPCTDQDSPPECPWSSEDNPVLLVSLDGFRAEYVLRNLTPVIQKLRTCGVHTPYMRAAYPTLTFPNHYTIVTGLYPESHGIVGNSMYDPTFNESFSLSSSNKYHPYWWQGEPLWITAKKQGKRTASYFWVGSDVNISGVHPDIWYKYSGKLEQNTKQFRSGVPFEERVDTVISWLLLEGEERPDFITLYFNQPDHQGHGSGPDSPEVDKMLGQVDNIIKRLMNGLLRHQLDHCVNLIIIADHGMTPTSCERQVVLEPYIPDVEKMLVYDGTTGHINPHFYKKGSAVIPNLNPMSATDIVNSLECKNSHLHIYTRETIPKRHHYTNSHRIGDVVMDIESSWLVYDKTSKSCLAGNHGYDNIYKSMHALFLAHGPDFKQNFEANPFENIELYNIMSELLHIEPAANNGTVGALHYILRAPNPLPAFSNTTQLQVCRTNPTRTESACSCQNINLDLSWMTNTQTFSSGAPAVEVNMEYCALLGQQFQSLYSYTYKMPVLSSHVLKPFRVSSYQPVNSTCVVPDPRLTDAINPDCSEYQNLQDEIVTTNLYDPGFAQSDTEKSEAFLSSNIVPMYSGFKTGIWSYLWRVIREYASQYKEISISTGPLFDYNNDGLWENINDKTRFVSNMSSIPLPSHYYMSLVKCHNSAISLLSCSADELDILSFILPHQPKTHNCIPHKDYLLNNVARLKDIEELAGIRFMTEYDRATSARLRTFLPLALWSSPATTPWTQLPCTVTTDHCPAGRPPVLLISLDGFRADYLQRHLTPTIERLSQCGVHTPYMRSVYPTVTFPNHYTIVTGLYPESHGIVYNNMVDEHIAELFSISKPIAKDPRWWKGEPIWITAQKQNLTTATYFWPGSDVNISGIYPDIYKHYDETAGYTERIYEFLGWLKKPKETRPDFMTLYFDQPDHAGHSYGPESAGVNGQLQTVDELINILITNLYEMNLQNCINIIIIADHGFDDINCGKTVKVSDYYKNITQMLMFERVFGQVYPQFEKQNSRHAKNNSKDFSVENIVNSLNCKHPAMHVFTKDTMPKRHHYTNSERIAPVLLNMETEWMVFDDHSFYCNGGNHGWDNIYKSMHALFLAHGPSFKQNFTTAPFENIELYNLMSELLCIQPAPNNGTAGSLSHILLNSTNVPKGNSNVSESICPSIDGKDVLPLCGCSNRTEADITAAVSDTNHIAHEVLILGMPYGGKNNSTCVLTDSNSAWALSKTFHVPVWISTSLSNKTAKTYFDEDCIVSDPRVPDYTINCTVFQNATITAQSLKITGKAFEFSGVQMDSTLIPMYKRFKEGIWKFINELVSDYVSSYGTVSVTTGAVFDYNNDGLGEGIINETRYYRTDDGDDVPIPSDIYIILAKCKNQDLQLPCDGNLDSISFIIPHIPEIPNCLSYSDYLQDNVARIRDIELITGLQFMTALDNTAQLRTFLAEKLWDSNLFRKWSDLPCIQEECQSEYRPLLLISLSGFRADYMKLNFTPTLKRLSECGVNADYMRAMYPTKTYPNHQTIVTGLYPESHGIIDDSFYDADIGEEFNSQYEDSMKNPKWWNKADPIWVQAKNQGLKTAAYLWPGSTINISGIYPDIWKESDQKESYISRVNNILSWFSLPKGKRPDFAAVYFDEPDKTGHSVGPSKADGVGAALQQVDDAIARLMEGLYEKKLHSCVNLVIVSDHGMADVSCKRLQRLKYYVDKEFLADNFWVWEGAVGRIANNYIYNSTSRGIVPNPAPISPDIIMKNITCRSPHLHPYYKSQLPVRLHYSNNDRIDDVILDMDPEWLVTRDYIKRCWGGNSGYDNLDQRMQAVFMASGPSFKQNLTVEPFENIELYNMLTEILNISAAPNNGTYGSLHHILQHPPRTDDMSSTISYVITRLSLSLEELTGLLSNYSCSGSCQELTENQVSELHRGLQADGTTKHISWGLPQLSSKIFQNNTIKLLYQPTFTSAFNSLSSQSLWVSQTLIFTEVSTTRRTSDCIIQEPRLAPDNNYCSAPKDLQWTPIMYEGTHDNELSDIYYRLSSIMVPVAKGFQDEIRTILKDLISQWLKEYKYVNLITGPVFDHNHDGIVDDMVKAREMTNSSLYPSHLFAVATRCKTSNVAFENCTDLLTTAYLIPNIANTTNCQPAKDFISTHTARVRDVEIITGLEFFTKIPMKDRVRLQTSLLGKRWTE